jgi:hypothetical protein
MDCCSVNERKSRKCVRKNDGKVFQLPRRFSRKKCKHPRGYSMKSSCAPYKYCFTSTQKGGKSNKTKTKKRTLKYRKKTQKQKNLSKKQFLYNPDDPKRSFDVYIDKNPKDTIHIKYKTLDDVKNTIRKLERLYKQGKYPHKRIWQVGMIMKVRLEVLKSKKTQEYNLSKKYFEFLGRRTKKKTEKDRKQMKFII